MANSGSSVDEDEDDVPAAARLPTQVRMNNSPFRKFTKTKRKSSKSNHGGKNKSNDERTGTVPVAPKKKPEKPESSRSSLLQSIGRSAARKYIQNHTVFPTDECFELKKVENSFSTILYNEFQEDSVYRNDQDFAVLLTSHRSQWYTCCNQVRGELIFKAKEKYFSEFIPFLYDVSTTTDSFPVVVKELSAAQQSRFGKTQCERMLRGRNEWKVYIEFLLVFGGIFVRNKLPKRTNLCSTIAKGNKLCDLMTINMEAFMRTVLFIGCSEDWPGYLNSKVYNHWLSKTYKVKATDNDDTEADDNAESEGMTTGGDRGDKSGSETMEGDPKDPKLSSLRTDPQ